MVYPENIPVFCIFIPVPFQLSDFFFENIGLGHELVTSDNRKKITLIILLKLIKNVSIKNLEYKMYFLMNTSFYKLLETAGAVMV